MELFDRLQTADELLNRIQDRIKRVLNPVLKNPLLDGRLVSALVTPAATQIEHKLGRVPLGYFIVSGPGSLVSQYQAADARYLYVSSGGGNENITFWVF